jgi:hypothetical protein
VTTFIQQHRYKISRLKPLAIRAYLSELTEFQSDLTHPGASTGLQSPIQLSKPSSSPQLIKHSRSLAPAQTFKNPIPLDNQARLGAVEALDIETRTLSSFRECADPEKDVAALASNVQQSGNKKPEKLPTTEPNRHQSGASEPVLDTRNFTTQSPARVSQPKSLEVNESELDQLSRERAKVGQYVNITFSIGS